jgi:hypothetical protein
MAVELASIGLGFPDDPLTSDEIGEIARDPEQVAILACLARIHVDSLKGLANQKRFPHQVLPLLLNAAQTIETVYHHPDIQQVLQDVSIDHRGRQHYFSAEMAWDEAKTLFAAAPLYQIKGFYLIKTISADK